jgi:hypothetical protein
MTLAFRMSTGTRIRGHYFEGALNGEKTIKKVRSQAVEEQGEGFEKIGCA